MTEVVWFLINEVRLIFGGRLLPAVSCGKNAGLDTLNSISKTCSLLQTLSWFNVEASVSRVTIGAGYTMIVPPIESGVQPNKLAPDVMV